MLRFQVFLLGVVLFLPARPHAEESRPVYLGLDGEFGVEQSTSAQAIERGILTAIDEINRAGGVLKGRPLQLVSKDNRSVTARGDCSARHAASAVDNGWAGVVIHGVVRDVVALRSLDLGAVALGSNPRKSAKDGVGERDAPVSFGGVEFVPGQQIWVDEDGVVATHP